jgi:hypothetical protein
MLAILENYWKVECIRQGQLVWTAEFDNLIPTAGLNKLLDATFVTGIASPTWYVGLVNTTPTYATTDTASSHAGWTENQGYAAATRPALTLGAIAAGAADNSGSKASYTINGAGTLAGCFLSDSSVKGGTGGTLYAEGTFAGGEQAVTNNDVVNVTVTVSAQTSGGASGFMPIIQQVFGDFHP